MAQRRPSPSSSRRSGMPEVDDADRQKAWLAVQAFNKIRPQLQAFARRATNNPKVIVEATSEVTSTNGSRIKIRPPLGLGDNAPHSRSECGKRNADGHQRCKACRVREVVDYYIFHEIAHIAFETHATFDYSGLVPLIEEYVNEWHPKAACQHGSVILGFINSNSRLAPIRVAHTLNEYMPLLFNALDDTRVNARTFEARPGLRTVFKYNIQRILMHGIEIGINKHVSWRDAEVNSQFIVGVRLASEGYDVAGYLHPLVVEALTDGYLQSLLSQASVARTANEIFSLSMEVFRHAQTMGFMVVDKCITPQPSPPPGEEGGEPSGSNDKAGDGESGGDDPEGNGDSDAGDTGNEGSGSSKDKSGTDGGSELASPDNGDRKHKQSTDGDNASQPGDSGVPEESGESEPANLGDGTPGDRAEHEQSAGSNPTGATSSGDPEPDGQADSTNGAGGGGDDSEDLEPGPQRGQMADPNGESGSDEEDSDSEGVLSGSQDRSNEEHPDRDDEGRTSDEESFRRDPEGSDAGEDDDPSASESDSSSVRSGDSGEASDEEDLDNSWPDDDSDPVGYDGHDPWGTPGSGDQEPSFAAPSMPDNGATVPLPGAGTPEETARALARFLTHGSPDEQGLLSGMAQMDGSLRDVVGEEEGDDLSGKLAHSISVALMQVAYMDQTSRNVVGYEFPTWPEKKLRWVSDFRAEDFMPPETLIAKAELKARMVFEENKRARMQRNRKSGHINTRALAKRAPVGDERLFLKKVLPGKRDYEVLIRVDISGSTDSYDRNEKIKRAVFAQCMLLHRLGIPFSIYADTAYQGKLDKIDIWKRGKDIDFYLYMLEVKKITDPWNGSTKLKLANLRAVSDNLDGHAMEYHRRQLQRSTATDKIIICYTDGMMPAANYNEEREILEREVITCARQGITLLGVGINTDSPKQYGMDTVRIDSDEDVILVVEQLGRRLSGK